MRKVYVFPIIFILTLVSFIGYCNDKVYDNLKNTYFGFANEQGTSIVATEYSGYEIKEPQKFSLGIFPNGKVYNLSFFEYRKPSPKSNGRQNSRNFDYCGGYYYRIKDGTTKDGESCMLAETGFIKEWKIINFQIDSNIKPDKLIIEKIKNLKNRKIQDIQILAKFGGTNYLYFVQFKTNTNRFFADLILNVGDTFYEDSSGTKENYVEEYQASFTDLGISQYCDVLNIFFDGKEYVFLLEWYTEEGTHLGLIKVQGNKLILIQHSSRYTYPV